jgi:hypothetical protein
MRASVVTRTRFAAAVSRVVVDKHCLGEDPVAKLRLQGGGGCQFHRTAYDLGKPPPKPDELEKTDRSIELNEQVDVAILAALVTSERAEERQARDTKRFKCVPTGSKRFQDVCAFHRCSW